MQHRTNEKAKAVSQKTTLQSTKRNGQLHKKNRVKIINQHRIQASEMQLAENKCK